MSNGRMEKKFTHAINGEEIKCVAKEEPSSYGQSVTVTFADKGGNVRNTVIFRCMPGVKDFDHYNNMIISDLIDVVIKRILSGQLDSSLEELKYKLTFFTVINDAIFKDIQEGGENSPKWLIS